MFQDSKVAELAIRESDDLRRLSVPGANGGRLVIGRSSDLAKEGALRPGEYKLSWEPTSPHKTEWKTNSGLLREAMHQGQPIRDVSPRSKDGFFLNAERNLLRSRGWSWNDDTGYWTPKP
jgi:hypothetical protein